jgi:primosomal replication protein N''
MNNSSATTASIQRIKDLLAQIAEQAKNVDQANAKLKAHRTLQHKTLFANTLFTTYSDKFIHYVNETTRKTDELTRLLKSNNNDLSSALLEQIEQQIASLTTALNANDTLHYDGQYRLNKRKEFFKHKNQQKRAKQAVQAITQSSQSYYQKLAEHHEFERRLATMIAQRELERAKCGDKRSQVLTLEILKLHQRLGRCRQAISQIERDIERSEKRI